jgi:hypothetical protein
LLLRDAAWARSASLVLWPMLRFRVGARSSFLGLGIVASVVSLVVGCNSGPSPEVPDGVGGTAAGGGTVGSGGQAGGGPPSSGVTWAEHISRVVYGECVGCHREGGVGPFPLETYAQVAEIAEVLAGEVAERHMPPMPVDGSGSCNTYSNARWLSEEEIGLFRAWADDGAPLGDAELAPGLPEPPAGLGSPDLVLDMGAPYVPNAELTDDYRCFVLDTGLTKDSYVVGYEVVPGDARIVHHAIVYSPTSDAEADKAVRLDEAEEGDGYTCFGGVGVDSEPRVLWAPGGGVTEMPKGTGVPLVKERKLILQVHYNVAAGAFPDRTKVNLKLAEQVDFPAMYQPIGDLDMRVEPGLEAGKATKLFPVGGGSFVVHGVMPHMHTLGRTLSLTARASGEDVCVVNVDRWDFHSQAAWWYAVPLTLDDVSSVTLECTFDTRSRTEAVTWGEGTRDEMCLTYLYVTTPT